MARLSKTKVIEAIEKMSGNVSAVARACGVSRQAIYQYMDKYPELKEFLHQQREELIDNVESSIFRQALAGNITAMIFILKTQARERGWVERQEISGIDDEPIKVTLIDER